MIISLPTNRNCRGSKGLFYLNADKLEGFMDATEKIQSVPHYSSNKQFPDFRPHSIRQRRACALQNRNSSIGKPGLHLQAAPA